MILVSAMAAVLGVAARADADTCMAVKKGAVLYSHADKKAKVGKVTARAIGFVEERRGAWYDLRFEQGSESADEDWSVVGAFSVTVRKKDVKLATCPRESGARTDVLSGTELSFTNGGFAGWSRAVGSLETRGTVRSDF